MTITIKRMLYRDWGMQWRPRGPRLRLPAMKCTTALWPLFWAYIGGKEFGQKEGERQHIWDGNQCQNSQVRVSSPTVTPDLNILLGARTQKQSNERGNFYINSTDFY